MKKLLCLLLLAPILSYGQSTVDILQNDTSICLGETIILSTNSAVNFENACALNELPSSLQSNLVAWYPFCGNSNDMSGNGNNSASNSASLTSDRFGNSNSAYSFNNSSIVINNTFYDNSWANYSISLWFLTNNISQSSQTLVNTIPHDGESLSFNHENVSLNSRVSHWKTATVGVHAWSTFGGQGNPFNNTNIFNNNWYMVTVTKSGDTYDYYINGVFDKTTDVSEEQSGIAGMRFGSIGGGESLNGKLDDIGFWNKTLTPQEIQDLYSSTSGNSTLIWSTGETTDSIIVTPNLTTTYSVNQNGSTDSIIVTVNPSTTSSTAIIECDTFTWNGTNYTTSGVYTFLSTNTNGCDSTATLNLTINPSTTTSNTTQIECDSYTWNGQAYAASGTYTYGTINVNGCDSTATLNLTINYSSSSTDSQVACDTYFWNGTSYLATGVYTFVTTNAVGCDSTATLNLMINPSTTSNTTEVFCDSYTWLVNGLTYTSSIIDTVIGVNAAGCAEISILDLTINNSTISTYNQVACDSYTWPVNGLTYTSPSMVNVINVNGAGCTETSILNLTISGNPVATILQNGFDLEVTISDIYYWSTSEITQTITPTANGWYWCIVTDVNGCMGDTAFYEVINIVSVVNETINPDRKIIKITDMLGQETPYRRNTPLFYIYDDGTVEKRIVIE